MHAYCFQAYAEALEVIPTTLAENAGLNPITIVTELRNRHARGERTAGINVRKVSSCTTHHSMCAKVLIVDLGIGIGYLGRESIAAFIGDNKCDRAEYRNGRSLTKNQRLCVDRIVESKILNENEPSFNRPDCTMRVVECSL